MNEYFSDSVASAKISADKIEDLVIEYSPMVKKIAFHLVGRLPANIDVNDLIQVGLIALIEAAKKWEPSRGAQFKTYATIRVRGAMIDEVRSTDWAPKSVMKSVSDIEKATRDLERKLKRSPSEREIAQHLGVNQDQYNKMLADARGVRLTSLDELSEKYGFDSEDYGSGPERELAKRDFQESLAQALKALPEREQLVLSLYYDEELNQKEIAQVLGIGETRVHQIRTQSIIRLRANLAEIDVLENHYSAAIND